MFQQIVSPNLSAVGRIGYCLEYASRLVFNNPAAGTTAWNAWEATQFKHQDQNFPLGVSFPVWFSGAGGAGHVAVFTPNGIYSSPWNTSTGHAILPSIAEVERIYGVKYVGWSEDILNLKLIEEVDMPTAGDINNFVGALGAQATDADRALVSRGWHDSMYGIFAAYASPTPGDIQNLCKALFKVDPTQDDINTFTKMSWKEAWYGLTARYGDTIEKVGASSSFTPYAGDQLFVKS